MTERPDTGSVKITLRDLMDAQTASSERLGGKIDKLNDRVGAVENKVDDLTVVNRRLAKHSERIDHLEDSVAAAGVTHERIVGRIDRLSDRVDAQKPLTWPQRVAVAGSGLGLIVTAITLLAMLSKLG